MVQEFILALLPIISSFSTDFISVATEEPYQTTIAVYGENLDYLLEDTVTIELGPLSASSVAGNSTGMNLTFTIDSILLPDRRSTYPLVIKDTGDVVVTSSDVITVFNPWQGDYTTTQVKHFLNTTPAPHKAHKRTVGLNVHWALGSETDDPTTDDLYQQRLHDSNTVWAREHFSYKLLEGDDAAAWLKRYDQIMLRYKEEDIRVVGMLAYGSTDDEFTAPNQQQWKQFVRTVVKRYRNDVDVWEIWNEPDSAEYLQPNTWASYRPLLKTGSAMIREYDPEAIVLNGAIADITNHQYIHTLYEKGAKYFDELNVHLYYCEEYLADKNHLTQLRNDWESLQTLVAKYRSQEHMWVTELGCSTGSEGVTNKTAKRYTQSAIRYVLTFNNLRPILLYTFRDRTFLLPEDPYEAYFGLLEDDLTPKRLWRWYKLL